MKVSILIPVYNSEKVLEKAIESAINQTWENIEIIIVDDGSSDNSLAIAQLFAAKHNIIQVYAQPNRGACNARNRAFTNCTGDYIQYLDADDILSPDKIKNQLALLTPDDHNTILSCPWVRFYKDEEIETIPIPERFLDRDWSNPTDWLLHAWSGKGMAQTSVWLTPRHFIEKVGVWDERLSVNQDGEFFCRVLLMASCIKFTNKSTVYYRSGNPHSVSQIRSEQKAADLLLSYRLYAEHVLRKADTKKVRQALAVNYLSFIYSYNTTYSEPTEQAHKYLKELQLVYYPKVGRKWFRLFSSVVGFEVALKIKAYV